MPLDAGLWTASFRPSWAATPVDPYDARLADMIAEDLREGVFTSLSVDPHVLRVPGAAWEKETETDRRGAVSIVLMYLVVIGFKGPLQVREEETGCVLLTDADVAASLTRAVNASGKKE